MYKINQERTSFPPWPWSHPSSLCYDTCSTLLTMSIHWPCFIVLSMFMYSFIFIIHVLCRLLVLKLICADFLLFVCRSVYIAVVDQIINRGRLHGILLTGLIQSHFCVCLLDGWIPNYKRIPHAKYNYAFITDFFFLNFNYCHKDKNHKPV